MKHPKNREKEASTKFLHHCTKKSRFSLRFFSVNVIKFVVSCRFVNIYLQSFYGKFFVPCGVISVHIIVSCCNAIFFFVENFLNDHILIIKFYNYNTTRLQHPEDAY